MSYMSNITRPEGDPQILRSGPGSLSLSDRLAKALGWFSIGLGIAELVTPRSITRRLGLQGKEGLLRLYGAREILSGVLALSVSKNTGLSSRVIGDGFDVVTLLTGLRNSNPKAANVVKALTAVVGITLLDLLGARATAKPRGSKAAQRLYRDRSGFPRGIDSARGAARANLRSSGVSAAL